jgi:hypothetical protein
MLPGLPEVDVQFLGYSVPHMRVAQNREYHHKAVCDGSLNTVMFVTELRADRADTL